MVSEKMTPREYNPSQLLGTNKSPTMFQFSLWKLIVLVSAVCVWLGTLAVIQNAYVQFFPVYALPIAIVVYYWRSAIPNPRAMLKVSALQTMANVFFTFAFVSLAPLVNLPTVYEVVLLVIQLAILQTIILAITSFCLTMRLPNYGLATLAFITGMINSTLVGFFVFLHVAVANFWGWG